MLHDGWPLTASEAVVLNLGALDETLVRAQDLYLCIKPTGGDKNSTHLCAVWRSPANSEIVYRTLDPYRDSLTPIALEMLADELPQLLQSLLIGVEHAINRVPLDVLTFPYKDDDDVCLNTTGRPTNRAILSPNGSPKCGLRRRDIVTKNKSGNGRYALRRMSNKIENDHKNGKACITDTLNASGGSSCETDSCSMPLFCMSGSFPHIDSDEESVDDSIKTSKSGKCISNDIDDDVVARISDCIRTLIILIRPRV